MSDKKVTIISKSNDLSRRIVEVNSGLSKWLKAIGSDYNTDKDILRLKKYQRQKIYHIYQYEILKGENPGNWDGAGEESENFQEWILSQVDDLDMAFGSC